MCMVIKYDGNVKLYTMLGHVGTIHDEVCIGSGKAPRVVYGAINRGKVKGVAGGIYNGSILVGACSKCRVSTVVVPK